VPHVFVLTSFGMRTEASTSETSTWQSAVGDEGLLASGETRRPARRNSPEPLFYGGRVVATKKAAPKKAAPKKAPAKKAPAKKAPAKKK
jgi:hypothetical protein